MKHIPGYLPESIVTENSEVRARGGSRMMEWGQHQLQIPNRVLAQLMLRYPELNSPDPETKTKAWKKYLRSNASKPYRTNDPKVRHGLSHAKK